MLSPIILEVSVVLLAIASATLFFFWHRMRKNLLIREAEVSERGKAATRQLYELAILKELGERIGYSLDVEKIVDIITGSLSQFIDYSVVAYMLLEPERVAFKVHLDKSVSRDFIKEIRMRMLKSLSTLLDRTIDDSAVDESVSGAIVIDEVNEPVRSFFNIPLVIGEAVEGVLTVAHTKEGLYREDEMTILYKITSQASNAVTKLQEVVRTERSKLSSMVASMAEGVVMTDTDYRIVVANPAALDAVGIPRSSGHVTIFDFIDRLGGMFDIRGRLEESVKLNKVIEASKVLIGNRFFQITVLPVKWAVKMQRGETFGGVVIFHDVTAEKRAERLRDDFTSMIVHELRAPLDGIKKITERLVKKGQAMEESNRVEYLTLVHKDASRMLALINDLLDAAKVEAGKFEVIKEVGNIKQVIAEGTRFFEASAENATIQLRVAFDPRLPKELSFDPPRVSQVLKNLVSNALKFTPSGGTVTVSAFFHERGRDPREEIERAGGAPFVHAVDRDFLILPNSVVISITDTGPGMSEEQIGMLFNKFMQFTDAATKGQKGSGLGLVIAKGIVEAHGGAIAVMSKEREGTTAYFTIPFEGVQSRPSKADVTSTLIHS